MINAVKKQNAISPGGKFGAPPSPKGVEYTYSVLLQERLVTEEEFGNIIVKSDEKGSIIRLKDIARLELGMENYNSFSRLNGKACQYHRGVSDARFKRLGSCRSGADRP